MPSVDDDETLKRTCTRFLHRHGLQDPAEQLGAIPAGTQADRYGEGGVVSELETEVAGVVERLLR